MTTKIDKFISEFETKHKKDIPITSLDFYENVLEATSRLNYMSDLCDSDSPFEVLKDAFADWEGSTKELEEIFLSAMYDLEYIEVPECHPELIPAFDIKVNDQELKDLYSVALEYTGSEQFRLYAMLVVRKLQRKEQGRSIPYAVSCLNSKSSESDLRAALDELGE